MNKLFQRINFRNIVYMGKKYTQQAVIGGINQVSEQIKKLDHSGSPFVVLTAYNHIKTIIAYYAIIKAGKIAVILSPGAKNFDITEIIEDVDPGIIIFINNETISFNFQEEFVLRKPDKAFVISSDLTDVCTIAYTNAEDGYSKGAMLTEKNLLTEIDIIINANKLNASSFTCSLLPFHHLFGLVQGIFISTMSGGQSLIATANILKINETVEQIRKYKITHLYSVPSILYIMSKVEGIGSCLDSVKLIISGGNKLSPFIYDTFYKKTQKHIKEGYGLTETSPACVQHYEDDEPNIESVGLALPGVQIKIIDELNNECPIGSEGEICISGDLVFKGYFNKEKATQKVITNGWLHTGDIGRLDKKGFVYFTGLKKNMINVAGNNVYPERLKRLMEKNDIVKNIAINAHESVLQGNTVEAIIELKNNSPKNQHDFKLWCRENISNDILPKSWTFI